ncbi:MAG: zinc-ribbon domain-containing protein [Ruminococcus sp.]|nr:zinc-ribbon domain-containing protein [Ruminococcus sp.]
MFCHNCGNPLPDNSKFCQKCGTPVPGAAPQPAQQPVYQQPVYQQQVYQQPVYQQPAYCGNGEVRQGIPVPGYSDRVNHPEILAAVKRNRRAAKIFALFLVPLPFIGFVIYSAVSDKMETKDAMLYGGIVSGIFLLFALFSFIRERAANTYEAVVIDKKHDYVRHHSNDDSNDMQEEYTTIVRTTDGKKKKYLEHEGSRIIAYNYLNVGDRFKYHPQFAFPYELYDKSKAPYLCCVVCGRNNPVSLDRCQKCGKPLLK